MREKCRWSVASFRDSRVELTEAQIIDLDKYKKVALPKQRKRVTIFVDPETESQPTAESTAPDGQSNVVLAKLYLDRLGRYDQLLRFLGLLSTLYVMNAEPWSESSSQNGALHSSEGVR